MSARVLEWRIREAAWAKEQAITTPPRKHADHSKWHVIAKQNEIPLRVFHNRIAAGWLPERAATEPLLTQEARSSRMKQNNPSKRVYPPCLLALAESKGVSHNLFIKRVSLGWSWERAASEQPCSRKECGRRGKQALLQQRGDINALIFQKRG
ncbi:hypothetical protein D3C76_1443310 [compost metagenome]